MDIWESNSMAAAVTPHSCTVDGQYRCSGTQCGDGSNRYGGLYLPPLPAPSLPPSLSLISKSVLVFKSSGFCATFHSLSFSYALNWSLFSLENGNIYNLI